MSKKEQKFYDALQNIFVGAKIDGQGGFINLMKIKSRYYSAIKNRLEEDVRDALKGEHQSFRDELFDKLWSFFSRYFTQNGSIYFNNTAFHNNVYEKVYTNEKDVVLFWKTQMLYYVKTDSLYQSMPIEFGGLKFYFDASNLENKKANEKKSLVFQLREEETNGIIHFEVTRSENGGKTKINEIEKTIQKRGISINSDNLKKAFSLFERQSEVDYFINKNAESFLKEQFKLWSYQYFWEGAPDWDAERVNQLQILKDIAFKIVDFIAQFEDELVKIWNKPKFVKNAHYVITLDRLSGALQQKVRRGDGYREQVKEWEAMGIKEDNPKVPVDTKHFKELELEILSQFNNLDDALDGWLIKSENYQALNTILPKFREKVQCIYIDPPFNTGSDFEYMDKFQDSTWLTIMEDRLKLSKNFLNKTGGSILHLDWNANYMGRFLMESVFGKNNFINEIVWRIGWVSGFKTQVDAFVRNHDMIYIFANSGRSDYFFQKPNAKIPYFSFEKNLIKNEIEKIMNVWSVEAKNIKSVNVVMKSKNNIVYKTGLKTKEGKYNIEDTWNSSEYEDINSNKIKRNAKEYTPNGSEITQKPEQLLRRIIELTTAERDIVLDYFSGSGTTIATAHKLKRKWIGVEMADYFQSDILFRMKQVLSCQGINEPVGITKEVRWQGGGFFKYYEMEQYEETLSRCKYEDGDIINHTDKSIYEQYVFLPDEKMLAAIEPDYENGNVQVNLGELYDGIDIHETLSNLTGKWIKAITKDKVIFADNTEIDTANLDYRAIKPLIWWE